MRDGAPDLLASIRYLFRWLRHVFADGDYTGDKRPRRLLGMGNGGSRSSSAVTNPFAWLNRNRRLAKDFDATVSRSAAWIHPASVQLLACRLARSMAFRR
jgi:hypothetical protein